MTFAIIAACVLLHQVPVAKRRRSGYYTYYRYSTVEEEERVIVIRGLRLIHTYTERHNEIINYFSMTTLLLICSGAVPVRP